MRCNPGTLSWLINQHYSLHSGGGLKHGCSSIPMYDPTEWIRREASQGRRFIVVTGNHRTNLLGFLASSDLAEEDLKGLAGNYGKSLHLIIY